MKTKLLALLLILLTATTVGAQDGGVIAYGSLVTGQIDDTLPAQEYVFSGAAGDLVLFTALPATRTLYPLLTLQNQSGDVIATSNFEQGLYNRIGTSLVVRLAQDGAYTLTIGRVQGEGLFLLRMDGLPTNDNLLPSGEPFLADVSPEAPFQTFQFSGGLLRMNATTPDASFVAEIFSRQGQVARLYGNPAQDIAMSLPALPDDNYTVVLYATDPTSALTVLFFLEDVSAADVPVVSATGCILQVDPATFGANVRRRPTTESDIITVLNIREQVPVLGRSGSWLLIQLQDGNTGWAFNEVGFAVGTCDEIPIIANPPENPTPLAVNGAPLSAIDIPTSTPFIPTDTPTPTPTATFTPTATYTPTPTFTPTATYTPTPTFTPVSLDANGDPQQFSINPNGAAIVEGIIAERDPSDDIRWQINAIDAAVSVTLAFECTGENVENTTFTVSIGTAPALPYRCGEQVDFQATATSNNLGEITVNTTVADAFVEWTVRATTN